MPAANRIYRVEQIAVTAEDDRLIRAGTPAQALRHAAQSTFKVVVASQEDMFALATAGVKIEDAGEEKAE